MGSDVASNAVVARAFFSGVALATRRVPYGNFSFIVIFGSAVSNEDGWA